MIHGLGASTYCWRHLIPILCRRYKVISFDLWGFGYSSKELQTAMGLDSQIEVIQELLDHLNVRSYSVIGHSMGGELALWLKKIDPRVRKCIAITPAAHPGLVSDWLRSFSWIANWTPLVLSASAIKRVLIRNLEDPSTLTEDMVQGYYEPYLDPKAHLTFAASLNVIRDPRVYNHLGEIDVDLVIWAAHDMVITYKHVKKMMEKLSVEKVITHPWAGHIPMEDDPEWLGKRVMHALET